MTINSATVFNDLLLSYSLFTLAKLDLLDDLEMGLSISGMVIAHHLDEKRLKQILLITTATGATTLRDDRYYLTELGVELKTHIGFLIWAIGGYSPLLENMDQYLANPQTDWHNHVRGNYVAIGSDEAHRRIMAKPIARILDSLPATCVADLGCGNAGRLAELLIRRPQLSGIGIDIDPGAITAAQHERAKHRLENRLELITENVFTTISEPHPELAKADLVMSYMMLHDLFNMPELDDNLFLKLRQSFPNAKYFVLADTCQVEHSDTGNQYPMFTLGFELVHAMRGIKTFPLAYYEQRFARSGLELIDRQALGVPNTYMFVLRAS